MPALPPSPPLLSTPPLLSLRAPYPEVASPAAAASVMLCAVRLPSFTPVVNTASPPAPPLSPVTLSRASNPDGIVPLLPPLPALAVKFNAPTSTVPPPTARFKLALPPSPLLPTLRSAALLEFNPPAAPPLPPCTVKVTSLLLSLTVKVPLTEALPPLPPLPPLSAAATLPWVPSLPSVSAVPPTVSL